MRKIEVERMMFPWRVKLKRRPSLSSFCFRFLFLFFLNPISFSSPVLSPSLLVDSRKSDRGLHSRLSPPRPRPHRVCAFTLFIPTRPQPSPTRVKLLHLKLVKGDNSAWVSWGYSLEPGCDPTTSSSSVVLHAVRSTDYYGGL